MLLEPHLSNGYPNLQFASILTGMSVRTLARRLNECGATYQNVVDELRFSKACSMLRMGDMPINDVAWSVGFNDHANFSRMFQRVNGISPRQFRQAELVNNTDPHGKAS